MIDVRLTVIFFGFKHVLTLFMKILINIIGKKKKNDKKWLDSNLKTQFK